MRSGIEQLQNNGKRVLFDSSRDALTQGLDSKPWLIKPNDEELSQFVGRELTTQEQCLEAAETLSDKGIDNIVVSMGAEGVLWLHDNQWLQAKPPKMHVVSTVGAGDTLVAGALLGSHASHAKTRITLLCYCPFRSGRWSGWRWCAK